jgi:hypothetical protein
MINACKPSRYLNCHPFFQLVVIEHTISQLLHLLLSFHFFPPSPNSKFKQPLIYPICNRLLARSSSSLILNHFQKLHFLPYSFPVILTFKLHSKSEFKIYSNLKHQNVKSMFSLDVLILFRSTLWLNYGVEM